ncbi:MAG: DUF5701 family protein [bacterium]|nr:DUF5701 family protein [bacterium]
MGPTTPMQVEKLIKLQFHEAAGITEGEFEECAGKPKVGGILVISETFISLTKQCALLGIVSRLEMRQLQAHENVVPLPKKFMYWCYGIDDGRAMRGISPETAIQKLSDSRRFPAHTALVLAIFREDIHVINENTRIDVGGSRIEKNLIPALLLGNGSVREHHPTLSSSELSSAGKPTYGMASFERAE